jgi:hypothetical protein
MDTQEAMEHLGVIRRIMESATRLTVLPGKAAIIGGILALIGCGVTWRMMRSFDFGEMCSMGPEARARLIALWVAIVVLAVGIDVLLTMRMARLRGANAWSRLSQLAAYSMGPCVATALALTVALGQRGAWTMAPAVWMMLYGAAVWMTGILSIRAPGLLGLAFFAAGLVTLFWAGPVGLLMIALTFGVGHIVYGVYLLKRFGA